MELHIASSFIENWDQWIVMPALTIAALVFHIRKRKVSTKFQFIGLLLYMVGSTLTSLFQNAPLHPIYVSGMVLSVLGIPLGIWGAIRYWKFDYVSKKAT